MRITNKKAKKMKNSFKHCLLFMLIVVVLPTALVSCDDMGKRVNSGDCKDRFDVQLTDGSAMWIYGGKVTDGYVKGNDEMGQTIWVPLTSIISVTEVDCGNGN
jgi:hypothetical protein